MRKHIHAGKHERDFYAHSNALDETCGDRRDVFDHTAVNLIRRWTESAIITANVFSGILYHEYRIRASNF